MSYQRGLTVERISESSARKQRHARPDQVRQLPVHHPDIPPAHPAAQKAFFSLAVPLRPATAIGNSRFSSSSTQDHAFALGFEHSSHPLATCFEPCIRSRSWIGRGQPDALKPFITH